MDMHAGTYKNCKLDCDYSCMHRVCVSCYIAIIGYL